MNRKSFLKSLLLAPAAFLAPLNLFGFTKKVDLAPEHCFKCKCADFYNVEIVVKVGGYIKFKNQEGELIKNTQNEYFVNSIEFSKSINTKNNTDLSDSNDFSSDDFTFTNQSEAKISFINNEEDFLIFHNCEIKPKEGYRVELS